VQVHFRVLALIERAAAYFQGKGYGSGHIPQEIKLARALLGRPPALAIDIGANVGNYSAALRASCPGVEIHAFEPSQTNINKLRTRFQSDRNFTLSPCAVAAVSGQALLYSNVPGSSLASLSKRRLDHFNIPFETVEPVVTVRFEEYWQDTLGRRPVDLAKIDIEGHELAALEGFGVALPATRVLQFEFGGTNISTRSYFQDFWYFFKDSGFDLFRITPLGLQEIRGYRETEECFRNINYVAVNLRD
jgi:FkbM family methyltransferase